jgi:hypothetical protein
MPNVLVVNDYSLEHSWDHARRGYSPFHFLYGVDRLAREGFDVTILAEEWSTWLSRLDRRLGRIGMALGSVDRQAACLGVLRRADVIYSPCQTQIQGLTYLRALGVIRAPIVCLAHHPMVRGRLGRLLKPLTRLMLRGVSSMPTLSRSVATEVNALLPDRAIGRALRWGPDADFYGPAAYPGHGILAAGRTGRDFLTFGRAATEAGVPATILALKSAGTSLGPFGANVHVTEAEEFVRYSETRNMFAAARALAIPMAAQDGLCGLTSLLDALGAGKPVIMTRNSNLDLDIEALGIGRWVDPGDVNGWVEAMKYFDAYPEVATEMGRRARALVDAGLNYVTFSDAIAAIVRTQYEQGLTRARLRRLPARLPVLTPLDQPRSAPVSKRGQI